MKKINYVSGRIKLKKINRIKRSAFLFLIAFLIFSFFARNNFKSVKFINPELFNEPIKSELSSNKPIEFQREGFQFHLKPLYEYEMSALVMNRFDYTWFSLTRADSGVPMDLCVTWGDNLKSGVYRHPSLKVRQDFRFCFVWLDNGVDFNPKEFSNNHLIIRDEAIRKKAFSVNEGDQIRLKGKLVDLKAENIDGKFKRAEGGMRDWRSSTTLADDGAGACEVIFVEELEIIKKGNPFFAYGFKISLFLLIALILWKIGLFISRARV